MQRDHGGNLDEAQNRFGHGVWIDLSTGINRRPWPVPAISDRAWRDLPTRQAESQLIAVAASWYGCAPEKLLAVAGASAAIQLLPRVLPAGRAAVLTPTYNEHAASLAAAGWQVTPCPTLAEMQGADLAVVVNPNNPDGQEFDPHALRDLAGKVAHLIVDESFADPRPDLSLAPHLPVNCTLLRSFGKFWGLAGVRLGFVIGAPDLLAQVAQAAGPWPVNGPALQIATAAMADLSWADDTITYHSEASLRLDHLALGAGWTPAGGTHLFRLYDTPDASAAQDRLARAQIWSRRFPYSAQWLRLGVPGNRPEWDRVIAALKA
ncbi:MAG: threonine-phosphate decarboxylase CobD [Paracoccus sp. (in: a-proteobacteria)]|nr:threonine-phosphate decarboxylase CobD [Paracoccus sp. (in: a-proteobacteria)]